MFKEQNNISGLDSTSQWNDVYTDKICKRSMFQ